MALQPPQSGNTMQCAFPVTLSRENTVACGRCMPCRINKKQEWTGKILAEAIYEKYGASFVTLTYSEETVPKDGSLKPEHLRRFLNNIRKKSGIGAIRYFAVGEYGTKSWRPHYHLALFGVPPTFEQAIASAWNISKPGCPGESIQAGFIKVGDITKGSAGYIAGYCTKKLTDAKDQNLNGRYPEFFRCSRRPPLGTILMQNIRSAMFTHAGSQAIAKLGGLPWRYQIGQKTYPYSKYWRKWLMKETGYEMAKHSEECYIPIEILEMKDEENKKTHDKLWRRRKKDARRVL